MNTTSTPDADVRARATVPTRRRPVGDHRPHLTLRWCRDEGEFASLGPEWERLHADCPSATPFQSHAWLHSWWRSYGTAGRLRVALVREGTRLLAAAPLQLSLTPYPALTPVGAPISDYHDVLLHQGQRDRAAAALTAMLCAASRRALIDLREVRPGAAAEHVRDLWPGPRRTLDDSVCLELPGLPVAELAGRLAGSRAQRVRAKLRKIDAAGVESRVLTAEEAPEGVRTLLRLHRLQWQDRAVTPEHLRPRFAAHLERAAAGMIAAGQAQLTLHRLNGETLAADLLILSPLLRGGYLYGADPRLREQRIDVTTMLLRTAAGEPGEAAKPGEAGEAAEPGEAGEAAPRTVLSLLRGEEPYKHHWKPEVVVNRRLLLASPLTSPLLAAATLDVAARGRARALRRQVRERSRERGRERTPGEARPDGR